MAARPALRGGGIPFEETSLEVRSRLLERMDRSHFMLLLMPLVAFKTVMAMHFFESEARAPRDALPGGREEALAEDQRLTVLQGREHKARPAPGTPTSSSWARARAARSRRACWRAAGCRCVVVLEEGDWVRPSEYGNLPPTGTLRRCWREGGLSAAVALGNTPFISVLQGKCVGGSSVLTGGVCFRIPDEVLHEWSHDLGLKTMTPEGVDAHFRVVEHMVHVETVPDHMRSRSTELFVEGAAKMGIPMHSMRRNTRGCRGVSRCSRLPSRGEAQRGHHVPAGRVRARRSHRDGRHRGAHRRGSGRRARVRGRLLGEDRAKGPELEVSAKVVVVACGSLHTPLLLRSSGLDSKHVGRHMTLHPGFRVGAIFDEVVDGWDGALQSVYSDHFASEGITLVSVYPPASVLSAAFPGVGAHHQQRAQDAEPRGLRRDDPRPGGWPGAAVARAGASRDLPDGAGGRAAPPARHRDRGAHVASRRGRGRSLCPSSGSATR